MLGHKEAGGTLDRQKGREEFKSLCPAHYRPRKGYELDLRSDGKPAEGFEKEDNLI